MRIVRRCLVIPGQLTRIDIDCDNRARKQVVAFAASLRSVCGGRITCAEDIKVCLGIVGTGNPELASSMSGRIQIFPGFQAGISRIHRDRIEFPLKLAGLGIKGLYESRLVKIVARTNQHMVGNDDGGHRREILQVEAEDFFVPALLAGASVEGYEVIIGRDEVQIVAPHPDTAIADVRAASCLPEVMPKLVPVVSIERPCVVGCGEVKYAVDLEHCTLDLGGAGGNDVARTFSTSDQWRSTSTGSVRQAP